MTIPIFLPTIVMFQYRFLYPYNVSDRLFYAFLSLGSYAVCQYSGLELLYSKATVYREVGDTLQRRLHDTSRRSH